jgi:trk system potassium uptake protein
MSPVRVKSAAFRSNAAPGIKPVLYLTGLVLLTTSGMMVFPMVADIFYRNSDWQAFASAAMLSAVIGGLMIRYSRKSLKAGLTLRQSFLLTPLSWFSVAMVSAMPFYFSEYGIVSRSFPDAFFESVSGITTTGATVISGLGDAPPGLLLWRALLQWMGGIGIIATAIAILPALGIGGMQLFRTESSDRSEKAMPRVRQIAATIALVYVSLTILATIVYWIAGMRLFDSLAHALTSIATGGYSTSDASFASWDENGIQWFAALFMLSGTIPFVLYVRLIAGEARALWDQQVRTLLSFLAVVIIALGSWLAFTGQYEFEPAFRHATFNVVSIVTTTGFASADYGLWGNWAVGLFFGLMFVGGCTGSTSGGIKIFRFEVMALMLRAHFMRLLYPRGVFQSYYGARPIDDEVIGSVVAFFSVFFLCYALLTIALMATGLDFLTSASGAVSALANIGPGLGEIIGPSGNFGPLPDGAKWLMSFGMLLGRLELFTVLILFAPRFWRG